MKDYASGSYFNKPLGQILVEAGLISMSQIELALREQKQSNLKIGEILTLHGWIKQQTADFFAEQWKSLLLEEQKKPLIYYFQQAALTEAYLYQADFSAADLREAKLSSEYSYEVYYDENTRFDSDIEPHLRGWKKK